ncbi:uncharacterized protein N7477_000216 [Penicillium maclennaniae]|uniref:uncharacterized protein n=1 Tax=Penicillium maclennaniae TaxID=1343394 RepID=UPI00253FDF2E|nr:uncharacterized protein N7477_000216 [Penicillium maclennaniae]KAJ5683871.1 hypothetical protein N7477_000216 [Penicillium maclennaniae]
MFFYGSLADDVSIMTEACKCDDVICAVVMLTHFETLAGTSTEAWFQHVRGAAMMLESNGTESCREGFSHQVFRHLRLLVFVASILRNEEHVFSSPQWTESPFEIYPKAADKLIKHPGGAPRPFKTSLRAHVSSLLLQLYHWWTQCTTMMNFGELNSEARATSANHDSEFHALDPNHFPILHHSDMPTAALAALYDAANIIALRLLSLGWSDAKEQKPRSCVSLYEERIQRHARSIISAKDFIAAIPGPTSNRGSIMMGLPYQILRIWAPTAIDGTSLGCFTKPNELFSDVAVYILSNQTPKYFSQGDDDPSMEDSGAQDSHIDPRSPEIDGASLTRT